MVDTIDTQEKYDALTDKQWEHIYDTWDFNDLYDLWAKFDQATIEYEAARPTMPEMGFTL